MSLATQRRSRTYPWGFQHPFAPSKSHGGQAPRSSQTPSPHSTSQDSHCPGCTNGALPGPAICPPDPLPPSHPLSTCMTRAYVNGPLAMWPMDSYSPGLRLALSLKEGHHSSVAASGPSGHQSSVPSLCPPAGPKIVTAPPSPHCQFKPIPL